MFEFLAQITGNTGYAIGAGGVGFAGIGYWIINRQIKKVVNHVDNSKLHLREGNGYVPGELCEERMGHIKDDLTEIKESVQEIRRIVTK